MPHISIRLFGSLHCTRDEEDLVAFESDKVRALLAHVVVEAERPHRREKLAGLLWPDWPEQAARANLRRALANLRHVIGDRRRGRAIPEPGGDRQATPPLLLVSRQTIQFNQASDAWVDVAAFTHLSETAGPTQQGIGTPDLQDAKALLGELS
jgi:DNA-binding SARP family transcriptional activator